MNIKSLIGLSLAMMAATVIGGETIAPDPNNLAPEWVLTSAKILEEGGQKYFHIEDLGGGIASVAYPPTLLNGANQVKVKLQYRTNVAASQLHSGAWYHIAFLDKNNKPIKHEGLFLKLNDEWTEHEEVIHVPEFALKFTAQLRVQLYTPEGKNTGKFLDARNIVIELLE
ncbi:MAG: hypothetical protein WC765_09980 [Phycisphaerae bacterium]|jgi:hypothetical protein